MAPNGKRTVKIKHVLRSASRLPVRTVHAVTPLGRGRARSFDPLPGERPVVILRLQVIGCKNLAGKNSILDPFVSVSMSNKRFHTPIAKRTSSPIYQHKDATFDFPIFWSQAERLGGVELVVWSKDVIKKEYLGETGIQMEDWFSHRASGTSASLDERATGLALAYDIDSPPISLDIISTRANAPSRAPLKLGSVQIRLGFVHVPDSAPFDFTDLYAELKRRSRPSLVSAPATEGIGTIRSHQTAFEFADDGLSSDESDIEVDLTPDETGVILEEAEEGDGYFVPHTLSQLYTPPPISLDYDVDPEDPFLQGASARPIYAGVELALQTPSPVLPTSEVSAPPSDAECEHETQAVLNGSTSAWRRALRKGPRRDKERGWMRNHQVKEVEDTENTRTPTGARFYDVVDNQHPSSSSTSPASTSPSPSPHQSSPVTSSSALPPDASQRPLPQRAVTIDLLPPEPVQSSTRTSSTGRLIPRLLRRSTHRGPSPTQAVGEDTHDPALSVTPGSDSLRSTHPTIARSTSATVASSSAALFASHVNNPQNFTPRTTSMSASGSMSPWLFEPEEANLEPSPVTSEQPVSLLSLTGTVGENASVGAEGRSESKPSRKQRPSGGLKIRRFTGGRRSTVDDTPGLNEAQGAGTHDALLCAPSVSKDVTAVAALGKNESRKGIKRQRRNNSYNFNTANDIVGIVMLDIHGATDLPRLRNMTRTGWDMDPFVVISFGKKVFRTRVIRHSLNPVWNEQLLFHVRRYETNFKVQLTVLDWDKLSSNDHVGDAVFNVSDLCSNGPDKDPATGLYREEDLDGSAPTKEFQLPLKTAKEMAWELKHNPQITFRVKYQPYDALRQQFWRQYLKQYDPDEQGRISRLALTSMLDSLGSTLSGSTIDSFFTRYGKNPQRDELKILEAIQCLEAELTRPPDEKIRIDAEDYRPPDTGLVTPLGIGRREDSYRLALENISFAGPPRAIAERIEEEDMRDLRSSVSPVMFTSAQGFTAEPSELILPEAALATAQQPSDIQPLPSPSRTMFADHGRSSSSSSEMDPSSVSATPDGHILPIESDAVLERVINVKNCPLCHRPRLSKKAEVDIVTHLALCASRDWGRVDRIMVGNFVTPSQAQRKWYTKLFSQVSRGAYHLGANSANIIVQNRLTGQLEEEKMQVYVRLGIRLLYKGAKSTMEGARARRLLRSMTIKQGMKFDHPDSTRDILPFIAFHRLNVEEFLDPIETYRTFNQFFYRQLKPEARPIDDPDDPTRLVSAADCRLMTFETVDKATSLWIKGREFTVARLLGPAYRHRAEHYVGGALAIFRLAPQDYHRFHSPVDGVIGPMSSISGEYHTVNPQAIRTALDVYCENTRKVVPIESPQFGSVMAVCIGATMVGSIITTVEEGQFVKRGDEFGYFAFGGSTIVVLFQKGVVRWDEDLVVNGQASLETLVRMGMGIGVSKRAFAQKPS